MLSYKIVSKLKKEAGGLKIIQVFRIGKVIKINENIYNLENRNISYSIIKF